MWIKDQFGNMVNSDNLISLYVAQDGANYEVRGNSPGTGGGDLAGQFDNGGPMTQTDAQGLLEKMRNVLGWIDPAQL